MKGLKKLVSFVTVLCMVTSLFAVFAVTASVNAQSNVLFSTKFDSIDDWTGAVGNRFNTTSDPDSPLHGNVMASSKATADSKQHYTFRTSITSGKVVVSADLKLLANDGYACIGIVQADKDAGGKSVYQNGDSGAYSRRIINLGSGKLGVQSVPNATVRTLPGNGVELNKWYHVDIVIDMSDKSLKCYVDGALQFNGEGSEVTGLDSIYSVYCRSKCTTVGTATSYVDNVSVVAGVGDTSYISSVGNGYADIEFTQAMKGIDSSNITLKPVLGGSEIPVTRVETMGMKLMRVYFDTTALSAGSEYIITPAAAYTGVTGGELSAVTFNAPTGDGSAVYLVPKEDFNDFDGTLSGLWGVKENKTDYIKAFEVAEGNKALQINREAASGKDTRAFVTFDGVDTSNKDVTVEFKYYVKRTIVTGETHEEPFVRVYVDYDKSTATVPFEAQNGSALSYNNAGGSDWGYTQITNKLSTNKWYNVKMVIHNNTTVDYYIYELATSESATDKEIAVQTGYVLRNRDNIGTNKLTGLQFVHRTVGSGDKSTLNDGSVYIDDVSVYTTYNPLAVNSVRFKDVDGNTIVPQASGITPDVKAVDVTFSDDMNADTISVGMAKGSAAVSGTGTYNSSSKTYTYTLDECLEPNSSYTLSIGKSSASANGKKLENDVTYTFQTGTGALRVLNFAITDTNGSEVKLANITADTELKINAKIVNTSGVSQDVSLAYGVYNGDNLGGVNTVGDTLSGANTYFDETLTFRCADITKLGIKGFLWSNMSSIYPLAENIELK